ncbi:uncharacterized protein LOC104900270 isoform X1 [Beta vulgaris subsp. vulgaris]|uniref:uncharacterized protein LOC104900270 isoform X1 n=1 Tax=Beta vulgaris subsp. vulgaris TaxID=3555 RepID=UPI002036AB59|nr:uncharacterized protein LOC104900270 isoform X1 [Beta vulgaris subsp. vulgaris]XP_048503719.1 uncharacterized protein LOC104900270 isoform X1 [Beta vulgaris subsp. vulgaris]
MQTIHQRGCPLELAKVAGCLTPIQHNNFSLLSTVVYSNRKLSKPKKCKAKNWDCRIMLMEQRCRQQLRAQYSDNQYEVLDDELQDEGELDGPQRRFREREEEKDYDKDPEFAEILGSCLDNPDKAQSKMEERLRKKRNKILQTKTGSGSPMKVTFNKFDYSNSYIWFEFWNPPLQKDVSLICDVIRSWHIIGRLGGCNSLNMQVNFFSSISLDVLVLTESPFDKRLSYDAIQGANVDPTTFYNIGDLEIQDNLARIWVDIGTNDSLILDVLMNALTQISSDFVGIKQVVFGGTEFENWKESLTVEDPGCSVHKI